MYAKIRVALGVCFSIVYMSWTSFIKQYDVWFIYTRVTLSVLSRN